MAQNTRALQYAYMSDELKLENVFEGMKITTKGKLECNTCVQGKMSQYRKTGGHFACACVNPLNDNSVGASNLMAGNRKLTRKITILLKAILLVL